MSINGHNTGSFDGAPGTKPVHDFLGSPVHDRGSFSYFSAWDIFNGDSFQNFVFNQITFGRQYERYVLGTNAQVSPTSGLYLRSTITGVDLISPGIYGAIFCREAPIAGFDPADQMCARLVGVDGTIATVSAPDNLAGYTTLPPGILTQQSDANIDGSGALVSNGTFGHPNWGALQAVPLDNGSFHWFVVFDSRILLGSAVAFRPQFVQPLVPFFVIFSDGLSPSSIPRVSRNFFSVPFKTVNGAYVQSAAPSYPATFSFPINPANSTALLGFPSQFLPSGIDTFPFT